jgi:hypothetical protein
MRDVVDFNPPYQRESGIWDKDVKSTFIDSIINGLDVPKLYFELESIRRISPKGRSYQYAVIDGKQRLETIIGFLNGHVRLPENFWFYEDDSVSANNMTLEDLQRHYPKLAKRFLDYELPVVSVTSDSGDLIEEMFQRLNASTSLNAAERRNAVSGATRDAANTLAVHPLLARDSPIRNARYKYRELAAKFLAIEEQLDTKHRIVDTKAKTLFDLFVATNGAKQTITNKKMVEYQKRVSQVLDGMANVFTEGDRLLASVGTVVVYYIVFRNSAVVPYASRQKLSQFEDLRRAASRMGENDPAYIQSGNARLREYNVLVQSANDGQALTRRAEIISSYLDGFSDSDPLAGLNRLAEGEPSTLEDEDDKTQRDSQAT